MTYTPPQTPTQTLRGSRAFRFLWIADAASQHGTAAATAVVPLLAATTLAAGPFQIGVLTAAETAAFLIIGLPAGAWIDRCHRRRRVLIGADLVRALLFLAIPIAAWFGVLTLAQLIGTALAAGAATVFFDAAYQAYLPDVVGADGLESGYANLQITQSVGAAAGPGLGGLLSQLTSTATALAGTALGYVTSATLLGRIPVPERPQPVLPHSSLRRDIADGVRHTLGHPTLRALTLTSTLAAFFTSAVMTVEVLYFTRELYLDAFGTGIMLALSGVGSVVGAATTRRWTRRLGTSRALQLVPLLTWPAHLLLPLAWPGLGIAVAAAGIVIYAAGATTYNVLAMTQRQRATPDALRGRVNAGMRVAIWGSMPLGALGAGVLAEHIGTRTTLWIAIAGILTALAPLMTHRVTTAVDEAHGGRC